MRQGQDKLMSVPLPKRPRCGMMLLSLVLILSGCASPENTVSRIKPLPKHPRPAPALAPVYYPPEPLSEAPDAVAPKPAKAKKRPQVKTAEPPAPGVAPVLDNSLPEQIWQPAITRQTSLELKS